MDVLHVSHGVQVAFISMMSAARHSYDHLGAPPPEMILKALNTGFTSSHLRLGNPFAYKFTRALVDDLRETGFSEGRSEHRQVFQSKM